MENFICNRFVERLAILNIKISKLWTNNKDRFQGGCHGVSGATCFRATMPESAGSYRRPAQPLPTSVNIVTPTARATIPANNCRSTDISSCCITPLELIAIRHSSIFVSVCLPSTSQNISLPPVFFLITLCPHAWSIQ